MSTVFAISDLTLAALSAAFDAILAPPQSDEAVAMTEVRVAG